MDLIEWNDTEEYDFVMKYKGKNYSYEVKADLYRNGNMIFEFEYKGRPSGFMVTEAMWFVYVRYWKKMAYFIKTENLRQLCKDEPNIITCGDNGETRAYLFNRLDIVHNFNIVNLDKVNR